MEEVTEVIGEGQRKGGKEKVRDKEPQNKGNKQEWMTVHEKLCL